MEILDGEQAGDEQCALVKVMPLLAKRAKLGVLEVGKPPKGSIQSFRSSIAMNRTLGFDGFSVDGSLLQPTNAITAIKKNPGINICFLNLAALFELHSIISK